MSNQRNETVPVLIRRRKLKNRRVEGGLMRDGTMSWKFKRMLPDRTIFRYGIRLSREAMCAMLDIMEELESEIKRMKAE